MRAGLRLTIVWYDEDCVELDVRVSNGTYSGASRFYESRDVLSGVADQLNGLPSASSDTRTVQLGSRDTTSGSGGIRLSLHCVSPLGACGMAALVWSGQQVRGDYRSTADLQLLFEATSLDRFVRELRAQALKVGASASLAVLSNPEEAEECGGA